ncbi:hypothetical protein LTR97_005129 [Elasticomyces elasticus]|uniref:Uncharacterized protein n=1 Tax=Elasticomyces elasticus TaxID=574655 RepID=A0AAN7WCN1_9PEZI|nr:hypothetical protein LTR97_005129 [Elasticomyces elasticus]
MSTKVAIASFLILVPALVQAASFPCNIPGAEYGAEVELYEQGKWSFYDDNCNDFAGAICIGEDIDYTIGGPAGSNIEPLFCKNDYCGASDAATIDQCKSFRNGVWARCGRWEN